jgi:hypothetical protein
MGCKIRREDEAVVLGRRWAGIGGEEGMIDLWIEDSGSLHFWPVGKWYYII